MANSSTTKTVIVIAGPTAVGKTAVAIEIAKFHNTEIISADSRQCYKELNIGVARPSPEELQQVKHHFIASVPITIGESHPIAIGSIQEEVTAAVFEQYALQKADELFDKYDQVVLVGGTGLYIKAFCEGLDIIPAVSKEIRAGIINQFMEKGITWLQEEVRQKDPEFYKTGEIRNPHRLMRALEVVEATGKSILSFRKGEKAMRNFNIVKFGIELPKEELHERIHRRVDQMIEAGLVDEVKSLIPYRHLNALQTVGYKEIFDYLDKKISLAEAIEQIKTNTRQYAKRQLTWFKKDKEFHWLKPSELKLERVTVNITESKEEPDTIF